MISSHVTCNHDLTYSLPSFCMLLAVGIVSADLSTYHELQQCILYTSEMINLNLQLGYTHHTTFLVSLVI